MDGFHCGQHVFGHPTASVWLRKKWSICEMSAGTPGPMHGEAAPLIGARGRPHYLRSHVLAGAALCAVVVVAVAFTTPSTTGRSYELLGARQARAQKLVYDSITVVSLSFSVRY